MTRAKYTTVAIPADLAKKLTRYVKTTGYHSNSEFVSAMIRDILAGGKTADVREKLRRLGYNG